MDGETVLFAFAAGGIVLGIVLFVRGLRAYRHDRLVSSVATSGLDGIAAGEVRVSGVVEIADQALISPLQSKPCVWYRSRVEAAGDPRKVLHAEERAVHFRIRDGGDSIRVVPDGARWEIEPSFEASTGSLGEEPAGLHPRDGSATVTLVPEDPATMTELERQAAIDALLTVRPPEPSPIPDPGPGTSTSGTRRRYREALLEPGDTVTIVGQARPWSDVRADLEASMMGGNVDRAMADDIARARAAGLLAATPEEAWGNAAIPGFGIGRPTRDPKLDAGVAAPAVTEDPEAHREALQRHAIPADTLVVARGSGGTFAVYKGSPELATRHHDAAFALGLMGIVMAASSALVLGMMLTMRLAT
jgi:hypothetical protein